MAIDSAEKRKSASGIVGVPLISGVTPNSSKDQEWRSESGWSYSGILPVISVDIKGGCWAVGEVYLPGFQEGDRYNPGFQEGDTFNPGFQEGDKYDPGFQEGDHFLPGFQEGEGTCN